MKKINKKIWIPSAVILVLLLIVGLVLVLQSCSSCANGHRWGEWTTNRESTCSAPGERVHTCKRCKETEVEEIPTLAHESVNVWDSGETRHWQKCTVCDGKSNADYHTFGKWEIEKEPTCVEKGIRKRTCKVCGKEEVEKIAALGHTYSETWSSNKTKHYYTCTVCNAKNKMEIHTYDKWETVKKATAQEAGQKRAVCTTCKYVCTETIARVGSDKIVINGGNHLTVGSTLQLSATGDQEILKGKTATWSSSNKSVATVNANGKVTARGLGRADITVSYGKGLKETTTIWVTETAIDGKIDNAFYASKSPFRWAQNEYGMGETVSLRLGEDGLYIADKVTDKNARGNGDKSHVEGFITLSDVFSMSNSFAIRFYPNGYSGTGSAYRFLEYEYAGKDKTYHFIELKDDKLPTICTSVVFTEEGYDIEAFIPWSVFELEEAPSSVYYKSVQVATYENQQKWCFGTYDAVVKSYTEKGIYDIDNYMKYDKKGFVHKIVSVDKKNIVLGNNFLTENNKYYTTEFYMHKLDELNPLTGASFSGKGAEYITELGGGNYQIRVPYSQRDNFKKAQTITILDGRGIGETFTLRIFDGTIVDDLTVTYREQEAAPVFYGTPTVDMTDFAVVTAETANLEYKWTLTCNGKEVTDFDINKNYTFAEAGKYVLTAEITSAGYEGSAYMTIHALAPDVYVNYEGGKIVNTGTDSDAQVGAYKAGKNEAFTSMQNTSVNYTAGINGDSKKAIVTNHKNGAYTVVKEYDFGTNDFTIATWFNVPTPGSLSTGNGSYIMGTSKVDDTTDGFRVTLRRNGNDNKFEFQFRAAGSTTGLKEFQGFEYGEWHHLVVVREGGTLSLYVNGSLIHTEKFAESFDFGTKALSFGGYEKETWTYQDSNMYFDDVQIYGEKLTEEQLQAIAATDTIPAAKLAPKVKISYTDGQMINSGKDSTVSVGAYKLDAVKNATKFEEFKFETSFATGADGAQNGAIITNHKNGPYTVVKGYNFGTNDFTISTKINIPTAKSLSTGNGSYIMGTTKADNTTDGFRITLRRNNGDNNFEFQFRAAGSTTGLKKFNGFEYGKWHKLDVVRKGTALSLYANGTLVHTETLPENFDFGTRELAFGGYHGETWGYQDGNIYYDDIKMYASALTENQVNGTDTNVPNPQVDTTFTSGIVGNTGTNTSASVELCKIDNASNPTKFASVSHTTTGIDGTANSAFITNHRYGPYTVVKGYEFGKNDFTVSTWFQMPSGTDLVDSSGTYLFGIGNPDSSDKFAITLKLPTGKTTPQIRFRLLNASNFINVSVEQNNWYNLTLTREGSTMKIYLSGRLIGIYSVSENCDFGTADLAFGGYYGFGNEYRDTDMYFDEIQVYSEALTSGQIKTEILGKDESNVTPALTVNFTGGTMQNSGANSMLTVGAYKLNANKLFESVAQPTYTTGRDGSANGAIITNHKNGPYTVVSGYPFGMSDFTISAWINVPTAKSLSTGNGSYIMGTSKVDNTTDGFRLTLRRNNGDNNFEFQFRAAGSSTGLKKFNGFEYGKWHHIVVVREGGALTLYANGEAVHTETFAESFSFGTKALSFGGYESESWGYQDSNMYFDDIQIYDEALTAEQIKNMQ